MTRRGQRALLVGLLLAGVGGAVALMTVAFRENLMTFHTPTDIASGHVAPAAAVRLGGLVERGSVVRGAGLAIEFVLADCENKVKVRYAGILPDLFREGQGIVATGRLGGDGAFEAAEVLAKHDENYMPPQLAESLTTPTGHSCAPFKSMAGGQGT